MSDTELIDGKAVDPDQILSQVLKIFKAQPLLNKDPDEVNLKDMELGKGRINSVFDMLSGIPALIHYKELIEQKDNVFKREDEMSTLNSLRRSTHTLTLHLERMVGMAQEKMAAAIMRDVVDADEVLALQKVLTSCIESTGKVIANFRQLVQLERMSGGRPWGAQRSSSNAALLVHDDGSDGSGNRGGGTRRRLTAEEAAGLEWTG